MHLIVRVNAPFCAVKETGAALLQIRKQEPRGRKMAGKGSLRSKAPVYLFSSLRSRKIKNLRTTKLVIAYVTN